METNDKSERIQGLIHASQAISDELGDLRVPHIFITFKNELPSALYYSDGGTFMQLLFLALTAVVKVIRDNPAYRPIVVGLLATMERLQKQEEEANSPDSQPEKKLKMDEAFEKIFQEIEQMVGKDEKPKKEG